MANFQAQDYIKRVDPKLTLLKAVRIRPSVQAKYPGGLDEWLTVVANLDDKEIYCISYAPLLISDNVTVDKIELDPYTANMKFTDYVKKKLGRKWPDKIASETALLDEILGMGLKNQQGTINDYKIIQDPLDTNVVPPQEVKAVEPEKTEGPPDSTPKVEETPAPSPVVETPTSAQIVRVRGEYKLEVVKPLQDTSKVNKDEPKNGPEDKKDAKDAAQQDTNKETTKQTTESQNGTKVAETKDVNTKTTTSQPGDPMVDSNGKPVNWDEEKPVEESQNLQAVLKVVGPNGNLVLFPDGTRRDIGDLTVVKKENPYDPEILKILNEEYPIDPSEQLDEEFVEVEFTGAEEAEVEAAALASMIAAEDQKDYAEIDKIWMDFKSGAGGGGGGGGGGVTDGGGGVSFGAGGGSVSGSLNFAPHKSKSGRGCIGKNNRSKDDLVRIMFDYVEGGYYHPIIGWTKFSAGDRKLYGSSGETMWGLDRYAGQTEKNAKGAYFWAEIDKISGNGEYGRSGLARKTPTRNWNIGQNPAKSGAWKWGYQPNTTKGSELLKAAIEYAKARYAESLKANFGTGELAKIIESDNRLQFMYFRATWNGAGWYQKYANNLKKVFAKVGNDPDKLIISDLNFRHSFSSSLIKHDAAVIARLIGANK